MYHFVGYTHLSTLLAGLDLDRVVYVDHYQQGGEVGEHGMRYDRIYVLVSQIAKDGDVHYWRFRLATHDMVYSNPMDKKRYDRRQAAAIDGFGVVYNWLIKNGLRPSQLVRGLVAEPKDFVFLEGSSDDVLRWDNEQYTWVAA